MVLIVAALLLLAPQDAPRLHGPVLDQAGVLTPAQVSEAEQLSLALQKSDSTQVALLTVRTTGGKDIGDYALEVARLNRIGQSGNNNGALIVIAVDDRRVRIEVGTGLEGRLTDALSSRIIRDEMVPHFRSGNFGDGALAGMRSVAGVVKGEYKAKPSSQKKKALPLSVIVLLIFMLLLFFSKGGRGSGGGWGWFWGGYLLGGMTGGGGGGSWGGGGGSGWSGGGGSFGGGGASGSW